jgi:hypothetical protein
MGIEYKIRIQPMSAKEAERCIKRLPICVAYDSTYALYNRRPVGKLKASTLPDAYALIEEDGIYFCDNLSGGSHLLLEGFIEILKQHFDVVTIEEL